jgi:pimeloyl-ACP methyl ester carboxylesterase
VPGTEGAWHLLFAATATLSAVVRTWLAGVAAVLVLVVGEASGATTFAKQDVVMPMDDGASIAATLYLPDRSPPAGGWPAIVFLHGLAGERTSMNALAEATGFVGQDYAVLTFDARGHGQSGGLVTIDGPREIADTRAVHAWLAARPDVADARIGAWGISYGGGAIFNSFVAGVPWGAVVTVETWTDLYAALMPQGLVKSGLVAGLLGSIPEDKRDPSLATVTAAVLAGNVAAVRPWALERSSLARLGSVTTPVFMAQGRRDFLFGIDQGSLAFQRLRGPKALYVGLHGHAPSTFPAADTGYLMTQARAWFDCHLRGLACDPRQAFVLIAPETFAGQVVRRGSLPPTRATTIPLPGVTTFARGGKAVRTSRPLKSAIEIFGAPTVQATIAASGGWSRLVAVLTARTTQGREIVVSAGGVPTRNGARKVSIRLTSQATFVPRGSRLTLTLASSSTAQASSNLLYLDLPMAQTARLRVGTVVLRLPGLRTQVTR